MSQIFVLLNTSYTSESNIEDIWDDCVAEFVNEKKDLFLEINNTGI